MKNAVKALVTVAAAAAVLALGACNAVKGAGKDLQEASDNTKKASAVTDLPAAAEARKGVACRPCRSRTNRS